MSNFTKFTNTEGDDLVVIPDTASANNGDVLTYSGSELKWAQVNTGTELSAGTDLKIENGIVSVNTNGTVSNSANMEFVAGSGTSANGEGAIALGFGAKANDKGAVAVGIRTSANGMGAHAEGYETSAIHVDGSLHAEGSRTYASNEGAHAEGISAKAKGKGSHAEGLNTSANGFYAHAEGNKTFAAGENSHAEGSGTSAYGRWTHAEGCSALAYSDYSHAEGYGTIASSPYMHVGGLYNATTANALFVIGNGSSNDRSDAFTVNGSGLASATKLATSGISDIEHEFGNKLNTSAIQFVATSGEAVTGTQGVIYIVTGTNS